MSDEGNDVLASDAKQLLESPACRHVFEAVVTTYRRELEESKHDDTELREHCYVMLKATRELHRQLTALAQKGRLTAMTRRRSSGGDDSAV